MDNNIFGFIHYLLNDVHAFLYYYVYFSYFEADVSLWFIIFIILFISYSAYFYDSVIFIHFETNSPRTDLFMVVIHFNNHVYLAATYYSILE